MRSPGCAVKGRLRTGSNSPVNVEFVDLHLGAADDQAVGRKGFAGRRANKVARHEVRCRDVLPDILAQGSCAGREPPGEPFRRRLCAAVQVGVHGRDRHKRRGQHGRFGIVAYGGEEDGGSGQEPDHWVAQRIAKNAIPPGRRGVQYVVAAVEGTSRFDLGAAEAAFISIEPFDALRRNELVHGSVLPTRAF